MAPGFSNRVLEQRYQSYFDRKQCAHDLHPSIVLPLIWLVGSVIMATRTKKLVLDGAGVAALWALPGVFQYFAPEAYVKHRRLLLIGHRLACLRGPSLALWLEGYSTEGGPSLGTICCVLVLGTAVAHAWLVVVGYRLTLQQELPLLILLAWRSILAHILEVCRTSYMRDPRVLSWFYSAGKRLTVASTFVMPLHDWHLTDENQLPHHAFALLATIQLVFGLYLPALAVPVAEQRCRHQFVVSSANQGRDEALRGSQLLSMAAQQLGLPHSEVLNACMFDMPTLWVRWLVILPPLAASTWLVVSILSASWAAPLLEPA